MYELTFTEITGGEPRLMTEEDHTVYRAWDAPIGNTGFFAMIFTAFTSRREGDVIRVTEYFVCQEPSSEHSVAKYKAIKQDNTWEILAKRQGGIMQMCREYVMQPWPPEAHRMIQEVLETRAIPI